MVGDLCYPARNSSHIYFDIFRPGEVKICHEAVISYQIILLSSVEQSYLFHIFRPGEGQILRTEEMTLCTGHFKVVILSM